MNESELSELAKKYFLPTDGTNVAHLIRRIQTSQGVTACFGTGNESCKEADCEWRKRCIGGATSGETVNGGGAEQDHG